MTAGQEKTAIITGATSGIGLALTKHLLSIKDSTWRVVMAASRVPSLPLSLDSERTLFVKADVSSWTDMAELFKIAWNWDGPGMHRIDFIAANAGTDDKMSFYADSDTDSEPKMPNLRCIEVNLLSVFYALTLFLYYSRKTQRSFVEPSGLLFNPKMVITGSCVGQYAFPVAPQYCASKHALMGLTRSVGRKLLRQENISINCVLPGFVPTSLGSPSLVAAWPKEHITSMTAVMRAFMELIDESGHVLQDGKSDGGNGVVKTAETVEVVGEQLFYRQAVTSPNESMDFLRAQAEDGGLWETMYSG